MGKKWDRYCQFEWILADLKAFLTGIFELLLGTIRGYSPTAGRLAQPIYKKRQYEDRLRDGEWGEGTLLNPKINMMGDRATLNFHRRDEGYFIYTYFDLVKENEKWSIIKLDWTWR